MTDNTPVNDQTDPRRRAMTARYKNPVATGLLNVLFPGAGYMYCGAWVLGLVVLALALVLAHKTDGLSFAFLLPLLVLDSFRVADQVNHAHGHPAPTVARRSSPLSADST